MATAKLTDKLLKSLKPLPSGRLEIWDAIIGEDRTLPGAFGIRVTDKGGMSWVIMYRTLDDNRGKIIQKRHKIGDYPSLSLADARTMARDALLKASRGDDPATAKQAARAALDGAITFSIALDQFIEKYAKHNTRGWKETKRVFDKYLKPELGEYRLKAVTSLHIRNLIEAMAETAPYMANRTLAYIRKFFNWAVDRELVPSSPVAAIKPPAKEKSRDRILTDEEVKAMWDAFSVMGWPFGQAFQLLLVTGQRRDEVAKMRWKDLDLEADLWTLSREATKADRLHEVPLSPLAVDILRKVKRTSNEYVFSTNGKTPISGFSRAKTKADEVSSVNMPEWRLHDLRRTAASNMAKLGIAPHVIEKVLNHSTGTISGVAAVYNRYGYDDEKRAALGTWARALEAVVSPSDSNVIEIRGR